MGTKGSNTTTSTSAPNADAMAAYQALLGKAQGVASTPFTPYSGEFTAPVNAQQNTGINNINQNAGFAQPYIQQAAGYANQAAQPITAGQIAGYQSPYTQQVVDATQRQFNNANAQQQQQVVGNAAAQGALGGDRVGVAQANLAGQQRQAQDPVIAGLYNSGYQNAEQMALSQQSNLGNAAYSLGNLGVAGQGAALSGAGAQVGAGSLQQSTQQQQDAALYSQFQQQQAYPFQTAQWLAGIDTGLGSQMGGTSQTTGPPPNPWNTFLGLGVAGLGAVGGKHSGGRVPGFDTGGSIGGMPYAGVQGYVPTMNITGGGGAPKPPGTPQAASQGQQAGLGNIKEEMAAFKGAKNLWNQYGSSSSPMDIGSGGFSPDGMGSMQAIGSAPEAGFGFGALYRRGGAVEPQYRDRITVPRQHFDEGGPVTMAGFGAGSMMPDSFDDRFYVPSPPSDPKKYNLLQDYGASQPDAFEGRGMPAGHIAEIPMPRPRPGLSNDEAPELPREITQGSSRPVAGLGADAGSSDAMAFADDRRAPIAGLAEQPRDQETAATTDEQPRDAESARSGLFGLNLSPETRQGLLAAGLGMMASRSPFLGQAVGEGGLQGLGAYSGAQKATREEAKSKADIEHGRKQLEQHAKEAADRLALDTKKLEQAADLHNTMTPYQKGQLDRETLKATGATTEDGHPILYDARHPGVAIDSITGEQIKPDQKVNSTKTPEPSFTPEELNTMARQYMAGDKSVLTNLGRGTQGASDLKALRKSIVAEMNKQGVTPEAQAVKMAEFGGLAAGQRALGTRVAGIELAANEARNMMKPALELSDKIARTNWVPVNKAIQMFETGTSDPDLAAWGAANFSLVNTYVRAIAPSGVPPESAREHALKMLNTAMGPEAYRRVVQQMDIEMKAALDAPEQVKDKFRSLYGGAPAAQHGPAPAAIAPQPAGPANDTLAQARAAIAAGAPRDAVIQRLRERGIDAGGL